MEDENTKKRLQRFVFGWLDLLLPRRLSRGDPNKTPNATVEVKDTQNASNATQPERVTKESTVNVAGAGFDTTANHGVSTTETVRNERRHKSDHHEQETDLDSSLYECLSGPVSEPDHIPDNGAPGYIQTFPESSFFKERRASTLPSPADIRAINERSGDIDATNFNRPPPVRFPSLGMFVKYGADASIVEAQTQIMLREKLEGRLPVPEVFGWTEDGAQTFIYMALVEGQTLMDRWSDLSGREKQAICEELRDLVKMFRSLKQDTGDHYIGKSSGKKLKNSRKKSLYTNVFSIGSLGKQPLKDIFLERHSNLAGPFFGSNAVEQFQSACDMEISSNTPIVFTHNDLLPPNIILSPGPKPKVAAIIDWAQAGWYPAYWEYCKARRIRVNPMYFDDASQEDWQTRYLPIILEPVDDESCYHPWLYFVLSKGI